jgi:hypothetical protein
MSNTRQADLHTQHQAGHHPNTEDRAAMHLASSIHYSESDHCVISWDAQKRAQDFFNSKGLAATLDEITRLAPIAYPPVTRLCEDCINHEQAFRPLSENADGYLECQECGGD